MHWLPAAEAAEAARAEDKPLEACLAAALKAAASGAEATKSMVASRKDAPRGSGERALGHMDPGAASAVTILQVLAESLPGAGV